MTQVPFIESARSNKSLARPAQVDRPTVCGDSWHLFERVRRAPDTLRQSVSFTNSGKFVRFRARPSPSLDENRPVGKVSGNDLRNVKTDRL